MVKISHLNSAMKNWLMIKGTSVLIIINILHSFPHFKRRKKNRTFSNSKASDNYLL